MQARKLVRLLNEMIKKDPKMAYKDVCLDRRYVEHQCKDFTFIPINDVETRWCIWNPGKTIEEAQREVIILGNY